MLFLDKVDTDTIVPPERRALGDPTTLDEVYSASLRQMSATDKAFSKISNLGEAYDARIDAVFKATGQRLDNPLRRRFDPTNPDDMAVIDRYAGKQVDRWGTPRGPSYLSAVFELAIRKKFEDDLARIAESNPDKVGALRPYVTIEQEMQERSAAKFATSVDVSSRAPWGAYLAGNTAAMLQTGITDPANLILAPFGFAQGAGKTLLQNAGRAAVTNLAATAAIEPLIAQNYADAGQPFGLQEAAIDIAVGGLVGGGLDLGFRAPVRAYKRARGTFDPTEGATKVAPASDAAPAASGAGLPPLPVSTPEEAATLSAAMKKFDAGDDADLMTFVEKLYEEGKLTDEQRGAFVDYRTSKAIADQADAAGGILDASSLSAATRHAIDPEHNPPPAAFDELPEPKGPALADDVAPPAQAFEVEGKPVSFHTIDPATVVTDAAAFQFKGGGDAGGVTDRLRSVKKWDPLASGKVIIFERADGQRVIADGHQRLGLAKRLAADGAELMGYVFRERDGWTPADVRAIAAKKNLQEGSGSILDGAKIIRERPDILDKSVPISEGKLRQSRMLARLSDEAFSQVQAGAVPEQFGALVGEHVPDPELHAAILDDIRKADLQSADQVRLMIAQLLTLPTSEDVQMTLFGELRTSRPLLAERTQVLDSALRMLKRDGRVFAMLEKDRQRIEAAGNQLTDDNAARAGEAKTIAELIETLATQRGIVSSLLNDSALDVYQGRAVRQSAEKFAARVRAILDKDGVAGLMADAPTPPPVDGAALAMPADGSPLLFALRAYHGSPHDFERFSFDKIGTGEGAHSYGKNAQAFGHGLYFAQSLGVANSYFETLATHRLKDGSTFDDTNSVHWAALAMARHAGDRDRAREFLKATHDAMSPLYDSRLRGVLLNAVFRLNRDAPIPDMVRGGVYSVDIDVEPHELLDWDAPIDAQPSAVREALASIGITDKTRMPYGNTGERIYNLLSGADRDQAAASAKLRGAGIKGIRYLDAGSRADGDGTRNFVIFDDSLITITAKNGKPVTPTERDNILAAMRGGRGASVPQPTPASTARVTGFATRPTRSPKEMAKMRADLDKVIATMPPQVRVRVEDSIRYGQYQLDGYYHPRDHLIAIALDSANPAAVARHEKVHALRDIGLIGDDDWSMLRGEIKARGLRKEYGIDDNYREPYTKQFKIAERIEAKLDEEAIAEMFARWGAGERFGGRIDALMDMLHKVLNAVREMLGARGVRTIEDIFRDLEAPAPGSLADRAAAGARAADAIPAGAEPAMMFALRPRSFTAQPSKFAKDVAEQSEDMIVSTEQAAKVFGVTPELDQVMIALKDFGWSAQQQAAFQRRVWQYAAALQQMRQQQPVSSAIQKTIDQLRAEAIEKRRVAMLTFMKTEELRGILMTHRNAAGRVDAGEALLSLLEHYGREGTSIESSVEGRRKAIIGATHARLEAMLYEFRKTALTGTRMNAARMQNVVAELFGTGTGDRAAQQLAKAWRDVTEDLRIRYNAAGGRIGQLKDWGLPQSHNAAALKKAGFDTWRGFIDQRLDWSRMLHPLTQTPILPGERMEVLQHVYNTITTDGLWNADVMDPITRGPLYRQHAEHRFLTFKNDAAWLNYQAAFGAGGEAGVFSTMMNHVNVMARDIAAMEVLGPNPDAALRWMKTFVRKEAAGRSIGLKSAFVPASKDPKARAEHAVYKADQMWAIMRGEAATPVHTTAANIFAGARNITMAMSLSAASLSSLTDFGRQSVHRSFAGAMKAARGGRGGMNIFATVNDVVQQFSTMKKREAVQSGLILQSALNVLHTEARYVGALSGPMVTQYIADRLLTWNGLIPLTQAQQHAFGLSIMASVADQAHRPWAQVPARLKRLFDRYGMSEAEWDGIRQFAPPAGNTGSLKTLTAPMIADRRLSERYLEMVLQETERAIPTGTVAGRALLVGDTRPGTVQGELMRTVSMLKSYGATVLMQDLGRVANEMKAGRAGGAAAFAGSILITSTIIGALVLQLKAISKGEDPRDMEDPAFWGAATLQGGGLGIFGDFMFGQVNRFGGGFSQTIGGPMTDRLSNAWNLTGGNVVEFAQNPDEPTNFGREAVRFARMNLAPPFYLRLAWERMVLDELQKMADPDARDAFRKQVQKRKKQFGQGYWWSPGESRPKRAPDMGAAVGGA